MSRLCRLGFGSVRPGCDMELARQPPRRRSEKWPGIVQRKGALGLSARKPCQPFEQRHAFRARRFHVGPWLAPLDAGTGGRWRRPLRAHEVGVDDRGNVDPGPRAYMVPEIEACIDFQQIELSVSPAF